MLLPLVSLAFAADLTKDVAKDTLDIGVLKNSEVKVVQKMLYRKDGALELGATLGVMPFDGYTVAPNLGVSATKHLSDTLGVELRLGGGYGLENGHYTELAGPTYGVAVEAYRYLASAEADIQFTLAYAKMNLGGRKVVHYDVYALAGLGATLESSVLPAADLTVSPTLPLGLGARLFTTKTTFVKFEVRDSVLVEYRAQSQTWAPKQNVNVALGLSLLLGGGK
ncbi:MAG: outer membrane beta-barrel domain-containing protein [Myxococcales bacterium]|nr:outer membrane beta-barrel domain-containing protein [Myxococcales bacterium]